MIYFHSSIFCLPVLRDNMNKLYFWITLGVLGFLLYISPGYLVRRMYEGFVQTRQQQTVPTSVQGVNLPPSNAPVPQPPSFNQIKNLQGILDTPMLNSPTAIPPIQHSKGLAEIPKEYDSTSSKPASANSNAVNESALEHGKAYLDKKPKDTKDSVAAAQCGPSNPSGDKLQPFTAEHAVQLAYALQNSQIANAKLKPNINQIAPPAEERVIVKREYVPEYIPVPTPAKCPDMRDYIRKDSIPCWACNLK